jgi:hypothetical protein
MIASSTSYAATPAPYPLPEITPREGAGMGRFTNAYPANGSFTGPHWTTMKTVNLTTEVGKTYNFEFYTRGTAYGAGFGSMWFFAVSFNNGASWVQPTFTVGGNQAGFYGYYVFPPTMGFNGLTSPYSIGENSNPNTIPVYGFGDPNSSPRGDWMRRAGSFTATSTTTQMGWGWMGYLYFGRGVAIDSIWVE